MSVPVLLARKAVAASLLQSARPISTGKIVAGYWNHDWRPDVKIPKTLEERKAAAKKYGMIVEDYETYCPDTEVPYGDYPKLPPVSAESRDPHALYDLPELKRNFGEPFHIEADMFGEDRYNINQRLRIPLNQMAACFFGFMSLMAFGFWTGEHIRICGVRMMPKEYPSDGKKHYSFELD